MNKAKQLNLLLYLWYIALLISMICCFRAISSISIILLIVTGLIKNKIDTGSWINSHFKNSFFLACCLFYALQVTGLLCSAGLHESSTQIQLKSAIIFVPAALCCCNYLNSGVLQRLMKHYIWMLVAALCYCLLVACYKYYFMQGPPGIFFYHKLVLPLKQQHAVLVSMYVFIGLVYLLEKARSDHQLFNKTINLLLIIYFTCFLLLLSSKLVIAFTAIVFIYYSILALKGRQNGRRTIFIALFGGLAAIVFILATQNKISKRFTEITTGGIDLIQQKNFDPGIYFNGLQFRLLQVRFVKEILTEKNAWLTGVSGEAQNLLDKKYIDTRMYIGDGITGDKGFLGYNTHNQFLESLLRSGIPGLLVFILICYAMLQLAIRRKNRLLTISIILLIAYSLNESVFENQYGIILFTFYPLFLYYGTEKK